MEWYQPETSLKTSTIIWNITPGSRVHCSIAYYCMIQCRVTEKGHPGISEMSLIGGNTLRPPRDSMLSYYGLQRCFWLCLQAACKASSHLLIHLTARKSWYTFAVSLPMVLALSCHTSWMRDQNALLHLHQGCSLLQKVYPCSLIRRVWQLYLESKKSTNVC